MNDIFEELSAIEGVNGILFLSANGEPRYKKFFRPDAEKMSDSLMADFPDQSLLIDEMEFVFENGRIYLKKMEQGVLILFLGSFAPFALVRVQCDLIRPNITEKTNGKKKSRFFGVF